MLGPARRALVERLSQFDSVVEIGIGQRVAVARELAATEIDVTAVDIVERDVPPGVTFVLDDITNPDETLYADADALYACNFPPELHQPALTLAESVDATLVFTTLGGDPPVVPVERNTVRGGTLYLARER
ncbi:UPF0146 family protein [Halovenus rubra]|uniref:UPF0146 protein ACFQJ7_16425 n=2 Tax=Halovenus rubra TaxID=869890 RepID=A0ABD5X8S3_9EURY